MMDGFEDYDNALMEEENIFNDVKWPIKIESVQNLFIERSDFVHASMISVQSEPSCDSVLGDSFSGARNC